MNARNWFSASMLVLLLLVGCDARRQSVSSDTKAQRAVREVAISLDTDQRILLDGETVSLEKLEHILIEQLGDDKADFVIMVAPKTPMGFVSDVQQQLPRANIANIRYPAPQG